MSFNEAYEEYLVYASKRHKKQGFETIRKNFNIHILPYFKDRYLCDLTKLDIIDWQNNILAKNYSNNFNRALYYEFSGFIQYCIYCSYLKENVVLQVERFKKKFESNKYDFYTLKEFKKFKRNLNNVIYREYFNFIYFYGTRPGETMALRFSDLKGRFIFINHSIERKGKRTIDTPKNQSSFRVLKVDFIMYIKILLLKRMYIKKYGVGFDYFIFGGIKPLAPTSIDRYKFNACKKANLRPITQHQFRHSYATRMIHKGVPIDYVSKSMGHSKVSTTLDIYLHQEKKEYSHSFFTRYI